jgi:hypothetical protein
MESENGLVLVDTGFGLDDARKPAGSTQHSFVKRNE